MKKRLLILSVVLTTVIIFIAWIFGLRYTLGSQPEEDSSASALREMFSEIAQSFRNLSEGLEKRQKPASINSVTDDELSRLKEKVLNAVPINE